MSGLPDDMREALVKARQAREWSQTELGQRMGLPQAHISGIETGRIVPRFDTLLELVRVLGHDLLLTPRSLVPAVQALIRDEGRETEERPLYAFDEDDENNTVGRHEIR